MNLYSDIERRRAANAKKLASLGIATSVAVTSALTRVVRQGQTCTTLYTVGYEKRDGDELMGVLRDQGVMALADVRQRPMSRKPDFRESALRTFCETAGIEYQPWPLLGSTVDQREQLHESGDFQGFAKKFRSHALKNLRPELNRLVESVRQIPTALLCYERLHEECHRSIIAELIGEWTDATVVAIV